MGLSPDFNEKGRGSVPFPISNPVFADYTVTGMIFLRGFTVLPHLQTIEAGSAGDSDGIETACNAETWVQFLGCGRSPEGSGSPFQHPCLENSMERGAW